MKKDNLDYIIFAIKQVHEALDYGFTLNCCNRNLKIAIEQYWKKNEKGLVKKDNIARSKKAQKEFEKKETFKNTGCIVEHVVPQKIIVDFLVYGPKNKTYRKEVLRKLFRVVVVTKEENQELTDKKLRSDMPPSLQDKLPINKKDKKAWSKALEEWDEEIDTWSRHKKAKIKLYGKYENYPL